MQEVAGGKILQFPAVRGGNAEQGLLGQPG